MTDVLMYENPHNYDYLQRLRPDYVRSLNLVIDLTTTYLKEQGVLMDFCCGTGIVSSLFEHQTKKIYFVDINKKMLDQITPLKNSSYELICDDVLQVAIDDLADLILNVFSFHHVLNKEKYVSQLLTHTKPGGLIVLAEIYLSNELMHEKYYDKLLLEIGAENSELELFLKQTAKSKKTEFKVSKQSADALFREKGFELVTEKKVWPLNDDLGVEEGAFVQVYKKIVN